jgi:protein SCO1/2
VVVGLALLAASAAGGLARGQTSLGRMGIDEHLGATVPLDLNLVDETGHRVMLRSLLDRPTILTLNYFTCAGLCTPQLNGIAELMGEIGLAPGKDFRVLTVSFDPRDTAEVASRRRDNLLRTIQRPVPPSAWRFLTGDEGSTKALTDAVGYEFQKTEDAFVHPGVIVVLTAQGRIARYIHGTSFVPADVQMALNEAARGVVRPTIPQLPENCRTSVPPGRDYARRVVRIAGFVTLAIVGLIVGAVILRGKGDQRGAVQ